LGTVELWRAALPALTTRDDCDLSSARSSYERVVGVHEEYCGQILALPEVVGCGITRLSASTGGSGISAAEALDYAISVRVDAQFAMPERPIFLDGVPVVIRARGLPRRVRS
jgi:hypothetical protein